MGENNDPALIAVNEKDEQTGTVSKTLAHEKGILHRAFSVFIFNPEGEWLLQQRAFSKYHSPGLWSNACCSHPSPGENTLESASARLFIEMGIACSITEEFSFVYKAEFDNGLSEHEFDHVFFGISDEAPRINPEEVNDWKYWPYEKIQKDISINPSGYTEWFKLVYQQVNERFRKELKYDH